MVRTVSSPVRKRRRVRLALGLVALIGFGTLLGVLLVRSLEPRMEGMPPTGSIGGLSMSGRPPSGPMGRVP